MLLSFFDPGREACSHMGNWYRVVKTIKGHRYVYDQQTYREGGHVRTLNRYIGRADGVSSTSSGASHSAHANAPLFRNAGDFGRAMAEQFDAPKWVEEAGQQLLGGESQRVRSAVKDIRQSVLARGLPVTTTPEKGEGVGNVPPMREIKQLTPEEQEKWSDMDPWIRSELSNNEYDSDEDLIKAFTSEGNMTHEEAAAWVSKRGFFLSNIVIDDGTVYVHPSTGILERRQPDHTEVGRASYSPRDVQAEITNTIVAAIETGRDNGTFQMPWQAVASEGLPVNFVTEKPYHGVNVLLLSLTALQHKWPNQWASFQQWKERGASVRKGEHGTPIVFYSSVQIHVVEEDEEGKKHVVVKSIPVFRYSTVFNIAQVDNAPDRPAPPTLVNPIENVEKFIASTKADIRYGGNRAYFSPGADYIQIPPCEAFTGSKTSSPTEAFYSTILHELCHWTGGKSRLNRDNHNRFGTEAYAAEELVAEIGAAFACATLHITPELRDDHVQYVASWLKILKEDKRAIFTASAAASRAVEYLEGLQPKAQS